MRLISTISGIFRYFSQKNAKKKDERKRKKEIRKSTRHFLDRIIELLTNTQKEKWIERDF